MNGDSLETLIKNVDFQLFELISHVICSICQELLNKPVTTPCGHSFCGGCIKRVLSTKNNSGCPLCKNRVKRYSLEPDAVKMTLSNICRELPDAFENDVKDLGSYLENGTEDVLRSSKVAQLSSSLECPKQFTKRKTSTKNKSPQANEKSDKVDADNDAETFLPVLKRSKKVIEYPNPRMQKADDLVSVSQIEVASGSSFSGSSELERKLEKIDKIKPEEKVKQWFNAVGDNIYLNSPNSSPLQSRIAEENAKEKIVTTMVRRDYIKPVNPLQSKENGGGNTSDPYEFIPSQNNRFGKKKKSRKSLGKVKKIPDFKSLQSFTKESIKRSTLLLNGNKEDGEDEQAVEFERNKPETITASQKFDQLLSEDKEKENKGKPKTYMLYVGSQSSSTQFLDASFHSQIEKDKKISPGFSKKEKTVKKEEFPHVGLFEDNSPLVSKLRGRASTKRKRDFDCGAKESFSEIMNLKSQDALELEKSVEQYLMERKDIKNEKDVVRKELNSSPEDTKLVKLLMELVNDDVVYQKESNLPVTLPKNMMDDFARCENGSALSVDGKVSSLTRDNLTQSTALLGFGTQEELPEEKKFKRMVEKMEEELNSEERGLEEDAEKVSGKDDEAIESGKSVTSCSSPSEGRKDQSETNVVRFDWTGSTKKSRNSFVDFLHLGKMTPTTKRSKTSVVKLVFPIGFSSFAKKRALNNRNSAGVVIPQPNETVPSSTPPVQKETCQVSAGIQTSQKMMSSAFMQTSQVLKSSANIQTSQEAKPSVEIQTTQKMTSSAEIQTSQRANPSVEIQTSQRFVNTSTGIQTSQVSLPRRHASKGENEKPEFWDEELIKDDSSRKMAEDKISSPVCSNEKEERTPQRRHFQKHRKIVKRKRSQDEELADLRSPEESKPSNENDVVLENNPVSDLLIDSQMENEFEKTWVKNTQKPREDLVALKNKKNIENSEKFSSVKSDSDRDSDDSDIRPPKKSKHARRILSQDSLDSGKTIEKYETRQMIPLDVRKVILEDDVEVVDLASQANEEANTEEQMLKVLKNIDMDVSRKRKNENEETAAAGETRKGEKMEESDSDFFVEQTPPRVYSRMEQSFKNASRSEVENAKPNEVEEEKEKEENKKKGVEQASEESDLIEDSVPKEKLLLDSFFSLSSPRKVIPTPPKDSGKKESLVGRSQNKVRGFPKEESFLSSRKPDENDQNQLNAFQEDSKSVTNAAQLKSVVDTWKRPEGSPLAQSRREPRKVVRIVASSVKNPETIKKFANKFKLTYLTKAAKDMTHLVVGLHENEEGEVLPLCTPKLLFAMANKKWIVSESWAESCLKMNTILPEDTFETLDPVGGTGCRKARLSSEQLLKNCEVYLLGDFQMISKEEFADLIVDCGGTLVSKPEKFSFSPAKLRMIIADKDCLTLDENQLEDLHKKYETVILSRDVIIMSIQSFKLANFFPYLLHGASEEDLVKMGYPPSLVRQEEEEDEEEGSHWSRAT